MDGPWSKGFPGIAKKPPKLLSKENMYEWQKGIVDLCESEPDDRTIHWYWDSDGCTGKTSLCKYLMWHHDAFLFSGKATDIASRIINRNEPPRIALMNITRTAEGKLSWAAIEEIKDGCISSGKYEGGQMIFDPPHVIIFANFRPDTSTLSVDRWNIVNIKGEKSESTYGFVELFNL